MNLHPMKSVDPISKVVLRLAFICISALLICAALGIALFAEARVNHVQAGVQGSCQFWKDLSQLPLTPQTTKTGFSIVADARTAYVTQGCVSDKGPLLPPDPRVVPYLNKKTP